MIEISNLKVSFKDFVALDIPGKIRIENGDRVGVIGSNGAGKTTLMKAILGINKYQGFIKNDIDYIAVHMQENGYSEYVSIRVIIESIIGEKIEDNKIISDLIDYFDFNECLNKRWKNLSGGQKQRLTLILVMATDKGLSIFDEVTSGLDFETRDKLVNKLNSWYKEKNSTLLITSHYYEELDNLVNKILLLDHGHVIAYGKKQDLFNKYCGQSIIVVDDTKLSREVVKPYKLIAGPKDKLVLSFDDLNLEKDVTKILIDNNLNYYRSNKDIEIMTINAKEAFYGSNYENK